MTKLDDALLNVTRLCFDTAPLIYFIERHPLYVDLMREIVTRIDKGTLIGFSSVITLTEVLTQPKRVGNVGLENQYRDLLLHSRNFTITPIDAIIAERAAKLRSRYNLRTPDALQIAAALRWNGDAFLTNDFALRRVTEVRILILDELGL